MVPGKGKSKSRVELKRLGQLMIARPGVDEKKLNGYLTSKRSLREYMSMNSMKKRSREFEICSTRVPWDVCGVDNG